MVLLSPDVLRDLALVLLLALGAALVTSRFRQPPVVGYLLAGALAGPFLLGRVANSEAVNFLADLGVTLLMFTIGIEFNFRKLRQVGFVALFAGAGKILLLLLSVNALGLLLGWPALESLYLGAALSVSSTVVVVRLLESIGSVSQRERSLVMGILIVEDLAAILLLTFLGSASALGRLEVVGLLGALWNMLLFFAAIMVLGLYIYPRFMDWLWERFPSDELLLLASVGLCFALAVLAGQAGFSVALGAFLAGAVVSEARAGPEADRLVRPMRNLFSVLFFVSIGLLLQAESALANLGVIILFVALLLPLRLLLTGAATYLTGQGGKSSLVVAASLLPVGEFSFILMKQGADLGVVRPFLFTTVVAISIIDAVLMPPLVHSAPGMAERGGRRLPAGLRTLLSSLTSGITLLGRATFLRKEALRVFLRKMFDVGANLMLIGVLWWVVTALGTYIDRLTPAWADFRVLSFIAAAVLVLPSVLIILKRIREMLALSLDVLARSAPAFQSQPLRRGMANGLFLVAVLLLALVALPVLSRQLSGYGLLLTAGFLGLVGVAAVLLWRSVSGLQSRMERTVREALLIAPPREAPKARSMERVLEGFRQSQTIDILEVGPGSPSAGKTISDLKLRTRAGVTVVSVERGPDVVLNPPLSHKLEAGDLLVVLGTAEERARAQDILNGKAPEEPA
ncbi:MAG: cation:proton antiporter [Halobacteria archaeon]